MNRSKLKISVLIFSLIGGLAVGYFLIFDHNVEHSKSRDSKSGVANFSDFKPQLPPKENAPHSNIEPNAEMAKPVSPVQPAKIMTTPAARSLPVVEIKRDLENSPISLRKIASSEKNSPPPRQQSNKTRLPQSDNNQMEQLMPKEPKVNVSASLETPSESDNGDGKNQLKEFFKGINFPEWWLSAGIGVNYTYTRESLNGYQTGTTSSIDTPQWSVRSGGMVTGKSGFDFIYKETTATISNSTSGRQVTEKFKWKIFSVEYLKTYGKDLNLFDYKDELYFRIGIQSHEFFTVIPVSANSTEVSILTTGMNNASIGFEYKFFTRPRGRAEFLMRYQYPFSSSSNTSGDDFQVTPIFSFDGSLGYVYKIDDHLTLGSYWFGQWQSYNFSYRRQNSSYEGSQQFFNSSVDIRLGLEF